MNTDETPLWAITPYQEALLAKIKKLEQEIAQLKAQVDQYREKAWKYDQLSVKVASPEPHLAYSLTIIGNCGKAHSSLEEWKNCAACRSHNQIWYKPNFQDGRNETD